MGYVVYVNKFHDKAVVHDESCSFYQNRLRDRTRTGYWQGVFKSHKEALDFAKSTGKKQANCTFCMTKKRKLVKACIY